MANFVAPFGVYADELVLTTARSLRKAMEEQKNSFTGLELSIETEEGIALLRCGGTEEALKVEGEIGMHSLHGTLRMAIEVEMPVLAETALERAFEQASAEKGATVLRRSSNLNGSEK